MVTTVGCIRLAASRSARRTAMTSPTPGTDMMSTFPLGHVPVRRSGYGAMQLAGPYAFGPPPDRASAIGVLRAAVAAGVDHIDIRWSWPGWPGHACSSDVFPLP